MQFFPLRFVHLEKPKKKLLSSQSWRVERSRPKFCANSWPEVARQVALCWVCDTFTSPPSLPRSAPVATCSGDASSAFVEAPKSRQLYVTYTTRGRKERGRQTDRATAYARAPHTLDGSFECLYLCTLLSQSPAAACLPLATRHLPHATCHLPLALFAWLRIILTTFGRKRHTNFIGKLSVRASATAITSQTNVHEVGVLDVMTRCRLNEHHNKSCLCEWETCGKSLSYLTLV